MERCFSLFAFRLVVPGGKIQAKNGYASILPVNSHILGRPFTTARLAEKIIFYSSLFSFSSSLSSPDVIFVASAVNFERVFRACFSPLVSLSMHGLCRLRVATLS